MLDLIGNLMRNEAMRRDLAGRSALGQAYQGAIQPDGTIDPNKAIAGLRGNPDAQWISPETITQLLGQQNLNFNRLTAQSQAARQLFGALPDNPTNEQLYTAVTTAVRNGVPPAEAVAWLQSITSAPNRRDAIAYSRNAGMSPGEQSSRVSGPPGPGGEQTTVPLAEANRAPPQGMPIALSADQQKSVESFGRSKEYTGQFPQRILPAQQALRAINETEARSPGIFGPGSEGRQDAKAWLQTWSPTIAKFVGVDPQEIGSYAEAKKYLIQMIQSRNQQLGGHSDQQLATTVSGNPNVQVTDLALPDLVRTAIAAHRAEQAQMLEAQKSGGPKYTEALSKWPARNDVRAFGLDLMPPDERAKFVKSLTPEERSRVNNSLRSAYEGGIIDRPSRPAAAAPPSAPAPAPPSRPGVPPKPPVPGVALGRRADGTPGWFISDPSRPGKHMEVTIPGLGQ